MRPATFTIYKSDDMLFGYVLTDKLGEAILHLDGIGSWMSCINVIVMVKGCTMNALHIKLKIFNCSRYIVLNCPGHLEKLSGSLKYMIVILKEMLQ